MRFPEPARMADDGDSSGGSPVWERRSGRGRGSNPLVGLVVTLLALFGALTAGLSIAERSVGEAGARIDGWISAAWSTVTGSEVQDEVAEAAGEAVEQTGDAAAEAGAAVERSADEASEALKGG